MSIFRRKPKPKPEVFTGNCLVRQHTGDGFYVGRCYHSTYNDVCPVHGNVAEWLSDDPDDLQSYRAWPKDYELRRQS